MGRAYTLTISKARKDNKMVIKLKNGITLKGIESIVYQDNGRCWCETAEAKRTTFSKDDIELIIGEEKE